MATLDCFGETCVPKGLRDFKMPQVFTWDASLSIMSILWWRIHISWISFPLMVGSVGPGCHVCIMWAFSVTNSAMYVVSPWTSHHKVSVGVQRLIQTHTAVLENLPASFSLWSLWSYQSKSSQNLQYAVSDIVPYCLNRASMVLFVMLLKKKRS